MISDSATLILILLLAVGVVLLAIGLILQANKTQAQLKLIMEQMQKLKAASDRLDQVE